MRRQRVLAWIVYGDVADHPPLASGAPSGILDVLETGLATQRLGNEQLPTCQMVREPGQVGLPLDEAPAATLAETPLDQGRAATRALERAWIHFVTVRVEGLEEHLRVDAQSGQGAGAARLAPALAARFQNAFVRPFRDRAPRSERGLRADPHEQQDPAYEECAERQEGACELQGPDCSRIPPPSRARSPLPCSRSPGPWKWGLLSRAVPLSALFTMRAAKDPVRAASVTATMQDPSYSTSELLMAHVGWIRKLARELVSDDQVEDLVQDTCVVALQRTPENTLKIRAWLASVVRNLARQSQRGLGRRKYRERAAARREAGAAPAELIERVTAHRELTQAVLDLKEPYRTAILLRYFEDLQPREIARRLEVPVPTLQSRLNRGLKQLRERLDRTHGDDRRAWLTLFIPLVAESPRLSTVTLGALAVNLKVALFVAGLTLAGVLAVAFFGSGSSSPQSGTALAAVPEAELEEPAPEPLDLASQDQDPERAAVPAAVRALAPDAEVEAAPASYSVRGRVLNPEGEALSGVQLELEGREGESHDGLLRSQGGGWFEFETSTPSGQLRVAPGDWVTVAEGVFKSNSSFDPMVVAARSIDLAGKVIDAQGRPLSDAVVGLRLPRVFESRFDVALAGSNTRTSWQARSDGEGNFELTEVPSIDGASFRVFLDGYELLVIPAPQMDDRAMQFVLERPKAPEEGAVRGVVVDSEGDPVPDARVGLGLASVLSDENGEFEFDLARAITAERITAVKEGHLPGILERPFEPEGDETGWPDHVRVEIGGPPLSIRGRLLDHEGQPVQDYKVWLDDATAFGPVGWLPTKIENLMAGGMVPPQVLTGSPYLPDHDSDTLWSNGANAGPPSAFWYWTSTDEEGYFEFPGLLDRSYRLACLDPETLERFESEEIQAGDPNALIRLPEPQVFQELSGVVLSEGVPVPGVRIIMRRVVYNARSRAFGGTVDMNMYGYRTNTRTDEEGRFRFERVPEEGIELLFTSDGIIPVSLYTENLEDPEEVEVEVETRCHMEVRLEAPYDRADTFGIRDEQENVLPVMVLVEGTTTTHSRAPLVDGRSGVVTISSRAHFLDLYKDGELVESVEIHPTPGEVQLVQP